MSIVRNRRRQISTALVAGVAAGGIAAVAIPSAQSTPRDAAFVPATGPLQLAPGRQQERGPITNSSVYLRAHRGTIRLEAKADDPSGGPAWAVRVFEADRMIPPAARRPGSDGVISVGLCAQLGRMVHGRFGWIDGTNAFRAVKTSAFTGTPSTCTSRKLGERHDPDLERAVLLDLHDPRAPKVRGSIVWGLTGATGRSITVSSRGRSRHRTPSGSRGAFLTFFGPNIAVSDARLQVRYADGRAADTAAPRTDEAASFAPPGYRPAPGDALVDSTSEVAARTFDPGGGPSWGMLAARTKRGLWCVGANGSLIDGHVGDIDAALGLLLEQPADSGPNGCGTEAQPTAKRPIQYGWGGGSYADPLPEVSPYGGALRLQHGRTIYWGRTLPDVDRITISTPRDVRTIVPSGPAHAFLVVYDGEFNSGTTKLTAHFKDGHTWSDRSANVSF